MEEMVENLDLHPHLVVTVRSSFSCDGVTGYTAESQDFHHQSLVVRPLTSYNVMVGNT